MHLQGHSVECRRAASPSRRRRRNPREWPRTRGGVRDGLGPEHHPRAHPSRERTAREFIRLPVIIDHAVQHGSATRTARAQTSSSGAMRTGYSVPVASVTRWSPLGAATSSAGAKTASPAAVVSCKSLRPTVTWISTLGYPHASRTASRFPTLEVLPPPIKPNGSTAEPAAGYRPRRVALGAAPRQTSSTEFVARPNRNDGGQHRCARSRPHRSSR